MGFAGAGVAEEHDGVAGVEVAARGEGGDHGWGDVGCGGGVELGEAFDAGEAGFADAAGPAPFAAGVDLGGQDLGKIGQVGVPGTLRCLGETGGVGTHDRQAQLARRGADRRHGRIIGQLRGHRAANSWS